MINVIDFLQVSFAVVYERPGNEFNIGLIVRAYKTSHTGLYHSCMSVCWYQVVAVVLLVVVGVYSGFKTNGFMRRNGSTFCELPVGVDVCRAHLYSHPTIPSSSSSSSSSSPSSSSTRHCCSWWYSWGPPFQPPSSFSLSVLAVSGLCSSRSASVCECVR